MLTAGQRCYSGPAAGGGLADRVSASNASHAPATAAGGGTHHRHLRAAPAGAAPPRDPAAPGWRGWPWPRGQRRPSGRQAGGDEEMAGGRKPLPPPSGPPSSRSGAQRLPRMSPCPPRCCPHPVLQQERVGGTASPHSPGDAGGGLDPSPGWAAAKAAGDPFPPMLPWPICRHPGSRCSSAMPGHPGSYGGASPRLPGNFLPRPRGQPLLPPLCSLPAPFYFRKVQITPWPAAVPAREQPWASRLVAAGPRGQSGSG